MNDSNNMFDVSTQDILGTLRTVDGEADNLYFLYIATPGKPPSRLHQKVIKPFLQSRGWKKVSYKSTGFRALYFLDLNETKDYLPYSKERGNDSDSDFEKSEKRKHSCSIHQATEDRTALKDKVEQIRSESNGSFIAHIILCKPMDYEQDFYGFASQPNSIE